MIWLSVGARMSIRWLLHPKFHIFIGIHMDLVEDAVCPGRSSPAIWEINYQNLHNNHNDNTNNTKTLKFKEHTDQIQYLLPSYIMKGKGVNHAVCVPVATPVISCDLHD